MTALLEIRGLVKDYQSLRPLRIAELHVAPGQSMVLAGLDAPAAEIFVHLVTGAALPDEGQVRLFGADTRAIDNTEAWLRSLDRLGIVSHRAVLVDMLSVLQNVAMPLTLDVDPIDPGVRPQVEALAREAGVAEPLWDEPLGRADPETLLRVRLARAVAPNPALVLVEHPSAGLPRPAVAGAARDVARIVRARGAASMTLTADPEWAMEAGGDVWTLHPASGALVKGGGLADRVRALFRRVRPAAGER